MKTNEFDKIIMPGKFKQLSHYGWKESERVKN